MHRRRVQLPMGLVFHPTDVQLISGYLYPKVRGGRLPWNAIKFSDQVYQKPPWEICTDLTAFPGDEKYYLFTELNKNQNRVVRTVGSYGTWHESSSKKIFEENNNDKIIGFKKLLNFKVKGEGVKNSDWLMHEFSLPEKETNLVLCVLQEKKKKEEMGLAYETCPKFEPKSFLVLDSTTSAEGNPCSPPAHDDHSELQALDLEEEETRPSKKMRSDPKFDDDPLSVASSSVDLAPDFWMELAAGFPDDVFL